MPQSDDLMALTHEAINAAFRRVMDVAPKMADRLATKPALAESLDEEQVFAEKPEPKAAQRQEYLALRANPTRLWAELEAAAQELPPEAPLPRALLQSLIEGERLIKDDLDEVRQGLDTQEG